MTTADAVRGRLRPGRLLPLGAAQDGAWLTEEAARPVLLRAAAGVPGIRLARVRLGLADPEAAAPSPVPPPPSALPPGPLRIAGECTVGPGAVRPLPELASVLREALFTAAEALDLLVGTVDLHVAGVHEEDAGASDSDRSGGAAPVEGTAFEGPAATAAAAAPGVARLTAVLGPPVHFASDHVRVEVAVARGHRPLDVVRAVRTAVTGALAADRPVTVLVTAVDEAEAP
ncbi:hypothetical protein ACH4E8_25020 [Streptomyces sp. NPDC017979]|uniref:hypothetical protein n=1 Tax=Streptomyces sp. NPDC017979 TaxID=3365024 RepID=UPI0037AD853C